MDDDEREAAHAALMRNVMLGYMEIVGVDEDGEMVFRLTEAGKARAENMIKRDESTTLRGYGFAPILVRRADNEETAE